MVMDMIEIIPYERDKDAKEMYIFLSWFKRKYKKEIKDKAENVLGLLDLYRNEGVWR